MNWLYYLAEANIYLGVFYLAYCLFLNRDTHYQLNRAYLIFSCIISFILPVLQVSALKPVKTAEPVNTIIYPSSPVRIVTVAPPVYQTTVAEATPVIEHHFTLQDVLCYLYLIGAAVLLCLLLIKLIMLLRLMRKEQSVKDGKYRVIYLPETDAAFSFFNYLFIGTNAAGTKTIIRHELVHIRQKHSVDILFLELLKVISWFNPIVYLLQNSLKNVHEYIADEQTAAYETDALTYSSFLVKNAYGAGGSSITHSFFNYNLLKKRIIMLNQKRSGNLARLKHLIAVPICAALLCASTLAFSKTYGWVDLAPANTNAVSRYTVINTDHVAKRKRLKVTENGVSTITDRFAIDQKNKKIILTAGTITAADKSLLLKKRNIKVEVVEDSTLFTTTDGKLMLPVVNADGYYLLDHFLHNKIQYAAPKGDKGGLVEVGFSLDNDRHITDAKIVKSGGAKLDAMALTGFKAYKGIVNDDPGKKLKIGVYFFTDDYSIFKTDSLGKDPEFGGELIITTYKYPVNLTSKGYEYDESGLGMPSVNGNNTAYAKVIIFEKNGEANWFYKNKATPADFKLLKDKYGYTFPSGSSIVIQTMHPKNVTNKRLAYVYDVSSYLDAGYSNHFYNSMIDTIEYPQQAKKALAGGVVILNFLVNKNGMLSDINIAKSGGNGFDEAALNALQSYKFSINDNAGKHSIAILFCVAEKKYRPVVSDKFKKEGYVGELAVSDVKSPFVREKGVVFSSPKKPSDVTKSGTN